MLDGIANGHVMYTSGTTFQSQAVYECDTGYQLSTNASRTCQDGGMWNGIAATCNRKQGSIVHYRVFTGTLVISEVPFTSKNR